MAGLNSIIFTNQNLINNNMKVLIIIKVDNDRGQSSVSFHVGWISALSLCTNQIHKTLLSPTIRPRKKENIVTKSLKVIHFTMYTLFKVTDVMGN